LSNNDLQPPAGAPQQTPPLPPPARQPMFNLPRVLIVLIVLNIAAYVLPRLLMDAQSRALLLYSWSFIPARLAVMHDFSIEALATFISYQFLHASIDHIAINMLTLAAIGSAIARILGPWRTLVLYFGTGILAMVVQLAITPGAEQPIVGASGSIAGLFGGFIIVMARAREMTGKVGRVWPIAIAWVLISVVAGFVGGPDGSSIAWIAHIGGFVAGMALMPLLMPAARATTPPGRQG
jgi:membrane associated rhomboid family serine protease